MRHLSSALCPTCGVAAGQHCLLHSGDKRSEPHTERKLLALGVKENVVLRKRCSVQLSRGRVKKQ